MIMASSGDVNHDKTMPPRDLKFNSLNLVMASPAPRTPPTTACVPEMGIEDSDEVMMKVNAARVMENMQII